jgi:K+-sensing histidine kinase KdpD
MDHNVIKTKLSEAGLAILLVAATMIAMTILVDTIGLSHGPMIFLIPVMIAATRWGLVPTIFAAIVGIAASAFFLYRPFYSFSVRDPENILNLSLFILVAVVTHQQLLKEVWGAVHVEDTHHLRIFVRKLRQKIEPDPVVPRILVTELGVGYRLAQSGLEQDDRPWKTADPLAKPRSEPG